MSCRLHGPDWRKRCGLPALNLASPNGTATQRSIRQAESKHLARPPAGIIMMVLGMEGAEGLSHTRL